MLTRTGTGPTLAFVKADQLDGHQKTADPPTATASVEVVATVSEDTRAPEPRKLPVIQPLKHLSYSRVTSFLGCRKAYLYRYGEGIVPRIDAPQLTRGTLVDIGLCAAIVADQAGGDPLHCAAVSVEAVNAAGDDWLDSEQVKDHAVMAGDDWLAECEQLINDSASIAARAARFIELGTGRWQTLAIPDPTKPRARKWQFGTQATVTGCLHVPADTPADLESEDAWLYLGDLDWIARDTKTDHVWLIDFKVRKAIQAEESLEFDYQLPGYVAALRQMGVPVHGAAHFQIRAAVPKAPALLKPTAKAPGPKLSRANITTDWDTYKREVLRHNLDPNDYLDVRDKLKPFDVFTTIYRSDEELHGVWAELGATYYEVDKWHKDPDRTAPRRLHTMQCRGCNYDVLCLAELRGHDDDHIRKAHYMPRER
jgi:hypothetical protein